jgi:pyridoxamine 5'-phosphate oxidase family protein
VDPQTFTEAELAYLLEERRLARMATVGKDGTPHVVPVLWSYNAAEETIDMTGFDFVRTKKFRDVRRSGRAAIVIDDIASVTPWHVRGIEVRGPAEALEHPQSRQCARDLGVGSDAGGLPSRPPGIPGRETRPPGRRRVA